MRDNIKSPLRKWGPLLFGAILFAWILFNLSAVLGVISGFIRIILPFIIGGFLAVILNIPSRAIERSLGRTKGFKDKKGLTRFAAMLLSVISVLVIIILLLFLVVPEMVNVVKMLIDNIPYYREHLEGLIAGLGKYGLKLDTASLTSMLDFERINAEVMKGLPGFLSSFIGGASSAIGNIVSGFVALVFSFYLVVGRDEMKERAGIFVNTFFPAHSDGIRRVIRLCLNKFQNYISAQCIEALIMGTLCTVGLLLLQMPYAVTIGVLVGAMVLLPIVGAFISVVVGAILIVAVDPMKALIFVVFLLILQQIEGNLIYPRVVGNKIGLPGMWVLVAIMVGGGLFGVAGIFLGVPAGSVIYILINEKMDSTAGSRT